jgi:hypothetical protein
MRLLVFVVAGPLQLLTNQVNHAALCSKEALQVVLQATPHDTQELSGTTEEKQSQAAISKALDTNKSRIDDEERHRNVVPREV